MVQAKIYHLQCIYVSSHFQVFFGHPFLLLVSISCMPGVCLNTLTKIVVKNDLYELLASYQFIYVVTFYIVHACLVCRYCASVCAVFEKFVF